MGGNLITISSLTSDNSFPSKSVRAGKNITKIAY